MSRNLLPKSLSLSLTATLMAGTAMAEGPKVATDIAPVQSLVARVMEGVGSPDLIIAAGASPHEYSLRPSEAGTLQEADLVFWIGPGLTPWLEDAIGTLAETAAVTSLLEVEGTIELPMRESALFEAHVHGAQGDEVDHTKAHGHDDHDHDDHDDHGHDDHGHDDHGHDDHDHDEHGHDDHAESGHDDHETHADHGHAHGAHDPHAWLSPDNAATWLNAIAAELSSADPDNAGTYFANAAAGREELATLSTEIDAILAPVRDNNFIVFHDAYQYFEQAFDIPASGAISISDAADPSPARIAEIQNRIADQDVTCVLSEPQFAPGIIEVVMDGTEARTGVLDPLGSDLEAGAGLYPQMLRNLAIALSDCLAGQ